MLWHCLIVIAKCLKIIIGTYNGTIKFVEIFRKMLSATCSLRQNGFTAYVVESRGALTQYSGRDTYYKILWISGIGEVEYGDTFYQVDGSVLLFTKPGVSCRWSLSGISHSTYICAFSNDFLNSGVLSWIEDCESYFDSAPVLHLNGDQETFVRAMFCRMVEEQKSSYPFKEELIQNQLCVLKHMALRMTPVSKLVSSAACMLPSSAVSLELVELGFPPAAQALHLN